MAHIQVEYVPTGEMFIHKDRIYKVLVRHPSGPVTVENEYGTTGIWAPTVSVTVDPGAQVICDWCGGDGKSLQPGLPCVQCGGRKTINVEWHNSMNRKG